MGERQGKREIVKPFPPIGALINYACSFTHMQDEILSGCTFLRRAREQNHKR